MTWSIVFTPDPKPARVKDRYVYTLFHDREGPCLHCGRWPVEAAHLLGGNMREDVLAGLIPLCPHCHHAWDTRHSVFDDSGLVVLPQSVDRAVARFLRADEGAERAAYLIRKLGPFAAEDYVQRLERRV